MIYAGSGNQSLRFCQKEKYSNSFRIPTTNLPSVQKIGRSYHLGVLVYVWWSGLFSGRMHFTALHNTNPPTAASVLWDGDWPCRQLQEEDHSLHMLHALFYEAVKQSDLQLDGL